MSDTKFKFEQVKKQLVAMQRETLVLLSNQAQNYFVKSFKNQGFNGEPWKEVQRRIPGTNAWKYPKPTKDNPKRGLQRRTSPILIGAGYKIRGGTLRDAVGSMSRTREIGNGIVRMIVDLPYAKAQNEGNKHLPRRQFIGQTPELTNMQVKKIEQIVTKIFHV